MSPQKEAAGSADHAPTAHPYTNTEILDEAEESSKYLVLQERAGRAGFMLMRVPSGYMLLRNGSSWHTSSLQLMERLIARRGASE
jgi:hypothetical protein